MQQIRKFDFYDIFTGFQCLQLLNSNCKNVIMFSKRTIKTGSAFYRFNSCSFTNLYMQQMGQRTYSYCRATGARSKTNLKFTKLTNCTISWEKLREIFACHVLTLPWFAYAFQTHFGWNWDAQQRLDNKWSVRNGG